MCDSHYRKWKRHGDPLAGRTPNGEPFRFYENVILAHQGDECLLWPYSVNGRGYGQIGNDRAHRFVCKSVHGLAPSPAHEVAHSCGKKLCVNPRHLRWATHGENIADKLAHGTHILGERNQLAKLTEQDARSILQDSRSNVDIAGVYGVHPSTIWAIKHRKSWGWLQPE
jgi:hypothetical protein